MRSHDDRVEQHGLVSPVHDRSQDPSTHACLSWSDGPGANNGALRRAHAPSEPVGREGSVNQDSGANVAGEAQGYKLAFCPSAGATAWSFLLFGPITIGDRR